MKRAISVLTVACLMLGCCAACDKKEDSDTAGAMRELTTNEVVHEMGVGINLGNTYEACGDWIHGDEVKDYETAWGSPVITQDMIRGYAAAGFGVLRVPVAWSNLMTEDYTISPAYLARVQEVVGWALDSHLYVILNIHWDGGWWEDFPTEKDTCMKKYKRIWEQLCAAFGNESDYLMFESLNEEGCWNEVWNRYGGTDGKEEAYALLNEINQTFVDLVRASGKNNGKRHLLIAGYATDVELTCDPLFQMPSDPAKRCAVSVHYYTPSTFCILEEDASWGKVSTTWGNDTEVRVLENNMDLLKTTFVDKDVPVIIGEYGLTTKNKTPEMIRLYLSSVCKAAYSRGMCPVLWDITDVFYDRSTCTMKDSELLSQLMAVKNDAN